MKKLWFAWGLMVALLAGNLRLADAGNTIVVRKDGSGPGGHTTIASATTVAAAGDTIEIQDSAVYDEKTSITLAGVNLKCTAAQRATIEASGAIPGVDRVDVIIDATDCTIENIKLRGQANDSQSGLVGSGTVNIKNCFIQDFTRAGAITLHARSGKVLRGAMESSSMVNCGSSEVYFSGAGSPAPTADAVGPFLIDHCTLLSFATSNVCLAANFPTNGGSITVKNSILGAFDKSKPLGTGDDKCYNINCPFMTEWFGWPTTPQAGAHPSNDINHSYNAYIGLWNLKWNWQDIDYISGNSELGPTEIGPTYPNSMDPGFTDPFNYDLSLKDHSKLIGKGEGGSTIGAYQSSATPGPQWIVRQDGGGDFTKIEDAFAAATFGDLIEIGDSGVYDLAMDVSLVGLHLRGVAGQSPTIKHTTGGNTSRCIYEMSSGGTLENVTLLGHETLKQMGMAGSGYWVVRNCTFKNFTQDSCMIIGAIPWVTLSGEVTGCYFINCGKNAIDFQGWASPDESAAGPFMIDHCTFVTTAGPQICLDSGYPSAGDNITVKNSILSSYAGGTWVAAKPFGVLELSTVKIVHHYNCFPKLDPIGFGFVLDAASELKDIDPEFTNISTGDCTLQDISPMIGFGENYSTIGADNRAANIMKSPLISGLKLATPEGRTDWTKSLAIQVSLIISQSPAAEIDIDEDPDFNSPTTLPFSGGSYSYPFDSPVNESKTVYVRARNQYGTSNILNGVIGLDNVAPPAPATPTDQGEFTTTTQAVFTWIASEDPAPGSGIASYDYQVSVSPQSASRPAPSRRGPSPSGASPVIFSGNVVDTQVMVQTVTGQLGVTLYCRVRAIDKAGNVGPWSASSDGILMDKPAPLAPKVSISPAHPRADDNLSATATPGGSSDYPITAYEYGWYLDGTLRSNGQVLSASLTTRDQSWECRVRVQDSRGVWSPAGTSSVTIANSPPTQPRVEILPKTPSADSDLTVRDLVPSMDPDGDALAYDYAWYKSTDGGRTWIRQTGLNGAPQVGHSALNEGDLWRVHATPYETGFILASAEPRVEGLYAWDQVYIGQNQLPTLVLDPPHGAPLGGKFKLHVSWRAEDGDGDPCRVDLYWTDLKYSGLHPLAIQLDAKTGAMTTTLALPVDRPIYIHGVITDSKGAVGQVVSVAVRLANSAGPEWPIYQ